jgi:hypothetical protein
MAPLPLREALSAIAVSSACPSWTRRFAWKHRTCQKTAAKRSSIYFDTCLHDIREIPELGLPNLRANHRAVPKKNATGDHTLGGYRSQDRRIRFFAIQA